MPMQDVTNPGILPSFIVSPSIYPHKL